MGTKIKGKYLIMGGVVFFIVAKILRNIFPLSLITQVISTIAELSWWIFVGAGIIVLVRERRERKNATK